MRLLFDTDLFCKLGVSGLIDPTLAMLKVDHADCRRLPALPHMLRRGSLVRRYGAERCSTLLGVAESIGPLPSASAEWLEPLRPLSNVDPGEVQLLAVAAESSLLLVSGDKRALREAAALGDYQRALAGRVVTFEAALLGLVEEIGVDRLREALKPLETDMVVKICFSAGAGDPAGGLRSYFSNLQGELAPLVLWQPPGGH
jgi:hypothetical protein